MALLCPDVSGHGVLGGPVRFHQALPQPPSPSLAAGEVIAFKPCDV